MTFQYRPRHTSSNLRGWYLYSSKVIRTEKTHDIVIEWYRNEKDKSNVFYEVRMSHSYLKQIAKQEYKLLTYRQDTPPMKWDDLNYWHSGEWQAIQERLDELDLIGSPYNPIRDNLFRALDKTPLEKVKVVILGQDPYPNPKHATGLAFDVPNYTKVWPPTLVNIHKELCNDLSLPWPKKPSLMPWAARGVLLWNATPTVQSFKSGHQPRIDFNGIPSPSYWYEWDPLTEEIVSTISERVEGCVFLLWGSRAQKYGSLVDTSKHKIHASVHPSPLSCNRGWWGSRPFSTANAYLTKMGKEPVKWQTYET